MFPRFFVVPVAGLEPAHHCWLGILSPPRLPIPTHRHLSHLILYHSLRKKSRGFEKIHATVKNREILFTYTIFRDIIGWNSMETRKSYDGI